MSRSLGTPTQGRGRAHGRIGILTFHRCINYGSYWQARCLAEGLRALGQDVVLLEHRSARVDRAEWRCALQPSLPVESGKRDHPLYRKKIRKFFEAFEGLPLSAPFLLDRPSGLSEFDLVLVGSDEVWNLRHPWYGGSPLFFGEGVPGGRVAAYAASFGSLSSWDRLDEYWTEKLRRFSRISVRDRNSSRLVGAALGHDPEIVLDPCLLFPQVIRSVGPPPELGTYAVVYGHSFPEWFQRAVRAWARRRRITLLSIGYRNAWVEAHRIDAGPEDFAQLIAGAGAVITNFFHGGVFSLVNGKPFACVLSDYRSNKIGDLAETLGARLHLIDETSPLHHIDAILDAPPASAVASRICDLRQRSRAYLDHVLH